jgi:hypothetical protein
MAERYGADNPFSSNSSLFEKVQSFWDGKDRTAHLPRNNFSRPEIIVKIRDHWMSKHGVENASQVPGVREKQLKTCLERYGDEQTLRVPDVRARGRKTLLAKYGVDDAAKSPEVRKKISETNMAKYGVPWTTVGPSREKQYASQVEKYGSKFFSSDVGKTAVRAALLASENTPKDLIRRRSASMNSLESAVFSAAPALMYSGNGTFWKYLPSLLGSKNPDFIVPGPDPLRPFKGVRKVVECLGVYWHGPDRTGVQRDDYESHLISCWADVGISCLVIWEDETWGGAHGLSEKLSAFLDAPSPSAPLSSLSFSLGDVSFSRSSSALAFSFLNEHHYAGFGRSAVSVYSASVSGEPVAFAKFARPVRQTIAASVAASDSSVFELDRFCIRPDCHLKNLASRFLSRSVRLFAEDHPEVKKIVSFSDPSEGHVGTIYRASNWKEVGKTSHSYFYLLPSGIKMNKKTLFNKSRSSGMDERSYAESIGAVRVSTPPKTKFVLEIR